MLGKRVRGYGDEVPEQQRLRANIADLFLTGDISGARAHSLFADAQAAQAGNVEDMAQATSNPYRDLIRRMRRKSKWPSHYLAPVRVFNPRTQQEEVANIAFLLPHEVVACMHRRSVSSKFLSAEGLDSEGKQHLDAVSRELGLESPLPLGLWSDGTPCNWDRTESIEAFTLNFPGLTGQHDVIRIPITAVRKRHVIKQKTFDDILSIISWSFQFLALGTYPSQRHDQDPWQSGDAARKKLAGKPLGCQGVLVEVRGDWKMFKETFRLPGWQGKKGCCWFCPATLDDIRDCSSTATWRSTRLTTWHLLRRMEQDGQDVSPLFSVPGVRLGVFKIDWLHTVDLGVACDLLGNLLWMILPKMPAGNRREKVTQLFLEIKQLYTDFRSEARLDNLTELMLRKDATSSPKLRAKAAEARAMVPVARALAERYLSEDDAAEQAARKCAEHLDECYACLSRSTRDTNLPKHGRSFCLLYVALEEAFQDQGLWKVKPKMHLFQELVELSSGRPSSTWTYRDEDFGGSLALMARSRGGANNPPRTAQMILTKFCLKHAVPRIE